MRGVFMSVRKLGFWGLALAVVLSFLAAGPAGANEEDWGGRAPKTDASAKKKAKAAPKKAASTEKAKTKTKGKAVSKSTKATSTKAKSAKPKAKAKAKTTAKTKVAKARRASPAKSHFPTQPAADSGAGAPADHPAGLPELSNEQKDDLPPPQNTEPQE